MTMSVDLVCAAAISRGRLKHSWLENQILNKASSDIAEMRREGAWDALEVQFPRRIQETLSLAENLIDGFSPAQIVDNLACFAQLREDARMMLKAKVHTAYLARCTLQGRQTSIADAAAMLSRAFQRVLGLWAKGSDDDLRNAWLDVLSAGRKLRDELDALPKGIVLP